MVMEINSNRIGSRNIGKTGDRKRLPAPNDSQNVTPTRAHVNFIPSPESLATMVRSAIDALRRGIFWDRGTILNLLV